MARLKAAGAEAGLRELLLEQAIDFREMYGVLDRGYWAELSKPVDQLVGGDAFVFYRYMLPGDHPARVGGGITDLLVLTEDDSLIQRRG